jgi:hypothetical protein
LGRGCWVRRKGRRSAGSRVRHRVGCRGTERCQTRDSPSRSLGLARRQRCWWVPGLRGIGKGRMWPVEAWCIGSGGASVASRCSHPRSVAGRTRRRNRSMLAGRRNRSVGGHRRELLVLPGHRWPRAGRCKWKRAGQKNRSVAVRSKLPRVVPRSRRAGAGPRKCWVVAGPCRLPGGRRVAGWALGSSGGCRRGIGPRGSRVGSFGRAVPC